MLESKGTYCAICASFDDKSGTGAGTRLGTGTGLVCAGVGAAVAFTLRKLSIPKNSEASTSNWHFLVHITLPLPSLNGRHLLILKWFVLLVCTVFSVYPGANMTVNLRRCKISTPGGVAIFPRFRSPFSFSLKNGRFHRFIWPILSGSGPSTLQVSDTSFIDGLNRAVSLHSLTEDVKEGQTYSSRQIVTYTGIHFTFLRCIFQGKTDSEDGGGIRVYSQASEPEYLSKFTMQSCIFEGCSARNGAGISSNGVGGVVVNDTLFFKCSATSYGAGMRCNSDGSFDATYVNCTQCSSQYMSCVAVAHTKSPLAIKYVLVDQCTSDGSFLVGYSSGLIEHVTVMSPIVGEGDESMIYLEQLNGDTVIDTLCLYDMPVNLSKNFCAVGILGAAFDARITVMNVNLPPESFNGKPEDMFSFGAQVNYELISYQFLAESGCHEPDYFYFEGTRSLTSSDIEITTEIETFDDATLTLTESPSSETETDIETFESTTSSSSSSNESENGALTPGEILGIVIAGLVAIALIIFLIICVQAKKRRWAYQPSQLESDVDNADLTIHSDSREDILNPDQL